MRIRTFRSVDIPTIAQIQQDAAQTDGTTAMHIGEIEEWLAEAELEAEANVFIITDDDETNEWGQAGTLEGVEGETVGYTVLQLRKQKETYHFLCQGAVVPAQRRRGAGRALLICALNRARMLAAEFEFEAEQEGHPIYFEALLPIHDSAAVRLATRCEMVATTEGTLSGMRLYRRELYPD